MSRSYECVGRRVESDPPMRNFEKDLFDIGLSPPPARHAQRRGKPRLRVDCAQSRGTKSDSAKQCKLGGGQLLHRIESMHLSSDADVGARPPTTIWVVCVVCVWWLERHSCGSTQSSARTRAPRRPHEYKQSRVVTERDREIAGTMKVPPAAKLDPL